MDRSEWENMLTCFQAFARGHMVRNAVRGAREDFECIVKEIDGALSHVEWRGTLIPAPHFTDSDGPFLRTSSSAKKPSNPRLDVCTSPTSPSSSSSSIAAALSEERGSPCVLLEKIKADRDDSQTKGQASLVSKDYFPSRNVRGDGEGQKERSTVGDKDGGVMESTGDSTTTAWSSLELDMSYGGPHKGPRQYCLVQDVPRTPEALGLHRNTLTMELLWLQQAVGSRKKYLTLKDRLTAK